MENPLLAWSSIPKIEECGEELDSKFIKEEEESRDGRPDKRHVDWSFFRGTDKVANGKPSRGVRNGDVDGARCRGTKLYHQQYLAIDDRLSGSSERMDTADVRGLKCLGSDSQGGG